jgi:hypothetical protein
MKTASMVMAIGLLSIPSWSSYSQAQGPPALCKPCLFYGGDYDPTDPISTVFYNEYTNGVGLTSTYGAVLVPKGRILSISGILFQTMVQGGNKLDPKGAGWEIRTNPVGNGGTLVASGGGPVAMEPTGRQRDGDLEYTISINLNPPVQIAGGRTYPGTVYWFNVTPVCTNSRDPLCATIQYFLSDTTQQTNGVRAYLQQAGLAVINSDHYPYVWEELCTAFPVQGCGRLSFGLMGTLVQ